MALYNLVNECQATPFAAERAFADTGEIAVSVETVGLEYGHYATILHPTVFDYALQYQFAHCISLVHTVETVTAYRLCYWEEGTRGEPSADLIGRAQAEKFLVRYFSHRALHLL